ncbi:DUF3427 domain-containing protein [Nocardioides daphniae]|uniref:DUF3427 domain-containing protein n=1 Tax=Nocardioides daphniae TaxID=402297 RepID=A0A4P7UEP1_9ACTN|nr:DUF3427 domain-containing protein [Nocardioides daphniae]
MTLDLHHGFLSAETSAPRLRHPHVVLNEGTETALRSILESLARADRFLFSVAFVTPGAIAALKQHFRDFQGQGTIVTSTYLGFNPPAAFAELLLLTEDGIDVRLHRSPGFHPKGYIFQSSDAVTAMVGSSNLTPAALQRNHEWNLKVSASPESGLGQQFHRIMSAQIAQSVPITAEWLEQYTAAYQAPSPRGGTEVPPPSVPELPSPPPFEALEGDGAATPITDVLPAGHLPETGTITPNAMQKTALEAIAGVRAAGERRAIVVSATGTGKTILSALAVKDAEPRRMLFVVHREQILDKTIAEYRRVLGGAPGDFGKLAGSTRQADRRYVFATVQTLSLPHVLEGFHPDAFDFIVFDEAHRVAAASHQKVLNHFTPEFALGMTATPERMDGRNVFEIFDFNVPYEIRLNHALEEGMLSPFHYYGIADVEFDDGTTTDVHTSLAGLVSSQRVEHLLDALHSYGQAGVPPRGLIFCSRNEEARALSAALNSSLLRGKRLRTAALSGADSVESRERTVRRLESGELDYVLTVDIFNEGVDIPSINQIIMLRQTQSAIVFVQQLGRGLRLAPGKEYVVVIDFIGNYANNYLIPIALFGDESLSKESLRKNLIAAEEQGSLPGLSSVQFDRISQERVLQSIVDTDLQSSTKLKFALEQMRNRVGRAPTLWDFYRFEGTDPVILATKEKHYLELTRKLLEVDYKLTHQEDRALALLTHEGFTARRAHEFLVLEQLLTGEVHTIDELVTLCAQEGLATTADRVQSVIDTFTLVEHAKVDLDRYEAPVAEQDGDLVVVDADVLSSYTSNPIFAAAVNDLIKTGKALTRERYLPDRPFTPGTQYGRKEVTRLLHLPRKWTSTLYGYKADATRKVCPIFVTLHKGEDVSASTAYEDALIDRNSMVWFTKSGRTTKSPLESAIIANDYQLDVFVKKSDSDGRDFYYLGTAKVTRAEDSTMKNDKGKSLPVVKTVLTFEQPIQQALFDYFHPHGDRLSHYAPSLFARCVPVGSTTKHSP